MFLTQCWSSKTGAGVGSAASTTAYSFTGKVDDELTCKQSYGVFGVASDKCFINKTVIS